MKEKIRIVHHSCLIQTNYVEYQNNYGHIVSTLVSLFQHRTQISPAFSKSTYDDELKNQEACNHGKIACCLPVLSQLKCSTTSAASDHVLVACSPSFNFVATMSR